MTHVGTESNPYDEEKPSPEFSFLYGVKITSYKMSTNTDSILLDKTKNFWCHAISSDKMIVMKL